MSHRWAAAMHSDFIRVFGYSMLVALSIAIAPVAARAQGFAAAKVASASFLGGVNIAGGEFNSQTVPGVYGKDYIYPSTDEIGYFAAKGAKIIRLPLRWERLQLSTGELSAAELSRIDAVVSAASAAGLPVILDLHNYGAFHGKSISEDPAGFAALWKALASHFAGNSLVWFDLMNEPKGLGAAQWGNLAQAAIDAIRGAGADNTILVEGIGWSHMWTWFNEVQGSSNADALGQLHDPENNYLIEVHQYFDADNSGTHSDCVAAGSADQELERLDEWLQHQGLHAFLGEFGAPGDATCLSAMDHLLGEIDRHRDIWRGWTYWAAGRWWHGSPLSIEPSGGNDAKQLATLMRHWGT